MGESLKSLFKVHVVYDFCKVLPRTGEEEVEGRTNGGYDDEDGDEELYRWQGP